MLVKSQTRFCFRFNNSKHIPPNENNKQVVESIDVHSIHTWLIIVLVKFFFFLVEALIFFGYCCSLQCIIFFFGL